MSDKILSNAELELTQKIQMHFPRGIISQEIIAEWNGCPKEKITEALVEVFGKSPRGPLLEFLGTVTITARTERFVAKEKFVVDTKRNAPVKISYLSNDFKERFLSGDGKVEDPIAEQTLRYARLRKSSVDAPIIAELGGEVKAETTLAEVYALMAQQPNGENGVLITNGYANIFYIRDIRGVLRAVYVIWDGVGWDVNADPVGDPDEWDDGRQVFSRNS